MKIAFVEDTIRFSIPLGITGIAAMLRQGGHEPGLFVIGNDAAKTIDRIAAYRPTLKAWRAIVACLLLYSPLAVPPFRETPGAEA